MNFSQFRIMKANQPSGRTMSNTHFRKLTVTAGASVIACLAIHSLANAGIHPRAAGSSKVSALVTHARELLKAKDAAGATGLAAKPEYLKCVDARTFRGPTASRLAAPPQPG